jgi:hypothetical protein
MTVETLRTRKRRPVPVARSHEDIYDLLAESRADIAAAKKKAEDAECRADMAALVGQRIETKLDSLLKIVGEEHEDERGERVGTGVVGRLMRLEGQVAKRFGLYDGWLKLGTGFAAAVALAWGVIWWLLSDRLNFLK